VSHREGVAVHTQLTGGCSDCAATHETVSGSWERTIATHHSESLPSPCIHLPVYISLYTSPCETRTVHTHRVGVCLTGRYMHTPLPARHAVLAVLVFTNPFPSDSDCQTVFSELFSELCPQLTERGLCPSVGIVSLVLEARSWLPGRSLPKHHSL
jgi:hypothetical protein